MLQLQKQPLYRRKACPCNQNVPQYTLWQGVLRKKLSAVQQQSDNYSHRKPCCQTNEPHGHNAYKYHRAYDGEYKRNPCKCLSPASVSISA